MRKSFLLPILGLFLSAVAGCGVASAQVRFGIKGGLNLANNRISDLANHKLADFVSPDMYAGFFVGPKLDIPLGAGFRIDVGALYSQNGTSLADHSNYLRRAIAVPLNIGWGLQFGNGYRIGFLIGPEWNVCINRDMESVTLSSDQQNIIQYVFSRSIININAGLEIQLFNFLQLGANYVIPCTKSATMNVDNAEPAASSLLPFSFSLKTGVLQFSAAIIF